MSATASRLTDRRTLLQILTVYTDAICLRDVTTIQVAPDVRITDNGQLTTIGKGAVWQMPGKLRIPYRRVLVDAKTGAACLRATVTNEVAVSRATPADMTHPPPGQWLWYVVRLKVVGGLITEIEEIVSDSTFPGTVGADLVAPDRIWEMIIPEEQRSTPEELQQIADDYFSTVSGTIPFHKAPFHPELNRWENGALTTNAVFMPGSCGTGLLSPVLQGLQVTNRRYYVVDAVLGVVAGIAKFTPPVIVPGGAVSAVIFEEFKIQDGLIRHIEAFFAKQGQEYSNWGTGPGSAPGAQ